MNKFLSFKDVTIPIDDDILDYPQEFCHDKPYDSILIKVKDLYSSYNPKSDTNTNYIVCDIVLSYGTIERQLGISKRDLYYLFSEKETITKAEILHKLLESGYIEDVIFC